MLQSKVEVIVARSWIVAAVAVAAIFFAPALLAKGDSALLASLGDEYFESRLKLYSLAATEDVGDPRFEGELAIDIAPAHRAEQAATFEALLKALRRVRRSSLSADEQLSYDLLKYDVSTRLESLKYPRHLLPIQHMECVPVKLAGWAGGQSVQPFKTVRNYENFLKRIERLPLWNAQAIANMREGMQRGIVQPRAIIERSLVQLKTLAEGSPEDSPFYSPIKRLPAEFSAPDKARLTAAYREALAGGILPSQARLYAFVRDEYLPHTRATAGLGALPGGDGWYAFQVRESTTTNSTPAQAHATGLREVARIHREMEGVKAQVGGTGTLLEFLKDFDKREALRPFKTEEEVLAHFASLNERIKPQLARLFSRAPKAALEIRPVDKLLRDTASSNYILPAIDGSRPGVFYAVVVDPLKYSTPSMAALFLHEGQPGHHFQMALQQELDIPKFRRFFWSDAYGEGWALYAESLGRELGVYDDPYSYLGRLQAELVRAVRLVVDTGLHAKGWSREQTIRYIMDTQGATEDDARRATERYMVWPGQALAYKTGELKILELRERAKQRLGDRFDLRAFHTEVLNHGSMPLTMLEKRINEWIAHARRAKAI
ncbi:MAG: DUF885 domain-containing protein [Proteobacteria bacterium]|nr:DUF885 domain-containing protein [Pseudomonadota bacterium]